MKTQNKKDVLGFKKKSVVELNDNQQRKVVGGATSIPCGIVWVAVETVVTKMNISFDNEV